jgi:phosphoglycerate dehydrogenase-like enzyme
MRNGIIIKNDMFSELYGPEEINDISSLVHIYTEPLSTEDVLKNPSILKDTEIIMTEWGSVKFDSDILAHLPNLKAVFYAGGSIKGIVSEEFWDSGAVISSAYGANAISVAQYTVSQILCCLKRIWPYHLATKKQRDFVSRDTYFMPGTYNTTLGIVSLGMIGWQVCKYIQAITEMRILAYDPYVTKDQARAMNIELCSLDDVFKLSDVVSVHTPVLDETKGMITGRHIRAMKQDSSIINTARGIIIMEDEMIEALTERSDILAVLDVTFPEPPSKESRLYDLENVILTPHIAGCMGPECIRMGRYMVQELERFVTGKKLKWQITKQQAATLA